MRRKESVNFTVFSIDISKYKLFNSISASDKNNEIVTKYLKIRVLADLNIACEIRLYRNEYIVKCFREFDSLSDEEVSDIYNCITKELDDGMGVYQTS